MRPFLTEPGGAAGDRHHGMDRLLREACARWRAAGCSGSGAPPRCAAENGLHDGAVLDRTRRVSQKRVEQQNAQ